MKYKNSGVAIYRPVFPRPVCLEKCTMNIPKGYEKYILMTLKAFSDEVAYKRKEPHQLQGMDGIMSIDVKSRQDKYRMLFRTEQGICKIVDLCTEKTH